MSILTIVVFFTARPGQGDALTSAYWRWSSPLGKSLAAAVTTSHRATRLRGWFAYEDRRSSDDFNGHMKTPSVQPPRAHST